MSTNASRRHFLRATSGLAASMGTAASGFGTSMAALAALATQTSQAATLNAPYRALVCLFMHGGNDSHNWIVPMDSDGYRSYATVRRELAVGADRLMPISVSSQGSGRSFGMPQELAPLRKWYESGQVAAVANVGPMLRPTTKADFLSSSNLPANLFSHNDQASTWQSLSPEGARSGWGGRMGDILMSANAQPVFTAVSATGNAVFLSGSAITQYQVGPDGPVAVTGLNAKSVLGSPTASSALARILASGGDSTYQAEYARVMKRSIDAKSALDAAYNSAIVPPINPVPLTLGNGNRITLNQDSLAQQLKVVAQMIRAGQSLGMRRQVFMVSMSGFDTHANQMRDQPSLMARVALGIDYFLSTMASLNMLDAVTLFTASDFGRTLVSNGSGSDHGWGSHHFVAGGGVIGRNIYGQFPETALGTQDDVGSGRLLPSTSVSQYAGVMGRWMGLNQSELATVLPGLQNFSTSSQPNFLGA